MKNSPRRNGAQFSVQSGVILIALLGGVSCQPTATPAIVPTASDLPPTAPALFSTPDQSSTPPALSPTTRLTPAASASPTSQVYAIVGADDKSLIGGVRVQDNAWLDAEATARLLSGNEPYRVYSRIARSVTAVGKGVQSNATCAGGWRVDLNPPNHDAFALALAAPWEGRPRRAEKIPSDTPLYRQLVEDFLAANGILPPFAHMQEIYKVDLEGDGVDEVLLSAARLREMDRVAAGDYSLVMIRRVVGNEAELIPLAMDHYPQYQENAMPDYHHLAAILDLNGDGRMEVVVDSFEGALNGRTVVYEINAGLPQPVLQTDCRTFLVHPFQPDIISLNPTQGVAPGLPPPTLIPQPTVASAAYPITFNGFLAGGVSQGRWLDKAEMGRRILGGEVYQHYQGTVYLGQSTGDMSYWLGGTWKCPHRRWFVPQSPPLGGVGVGGPWLAQPRQPVSVSPESGAYQQAIVELLRTNGIQDSPARLTEAWRIDVEGDGSDEVVVSAGLIENEMGNLHQADVGDYSLVALLRPQGLDSLTAAPVAADFYPQGSDIIYPKIYSLSTMLDLNGDGRLEVVVKALHWEGEYTLAYEVSDIHIDSVFAAGCSWSD